MCRLRPTTFFPPVEPAEATSFGGLDTLGVDDPHRWFGILAGLGPYLSAQDRIHPFPGAIAAPGIKVVAHGGPLGEVMRQVTPCTAIAIHIEQGIEYFPQINASGPTQAGRRRQQRFQNSPLRIGQVGRVRFAVGHARDPFWSYRSLPPSVNDLLNSLSLEALGWEESRVVSCDSIRCYQAGAVGLAGVFVWVVVET